MLGPFWEMAILSFYFVKKILKLLPNRRFFVICTQNTKETSIGLYIFWKVLLKPIWKYKLYMYNLSNYLKNMSITILWDPYFLGLSYVDKTMYAYLNIYIHILKALLKNFQNMNINMQVNIHYFILMARNPRKSV